MYTSFICFIRHFFKNSFLLLSLNGINWILYFLIRKPKNSFQDLINPLCNWGHDIESTTHFVLDFPIFINERSTFFTTLSNFDCNLLDNTNSALTQKLFFTKTSFKSNKNLEILIATIDFILSTKRFDEPLF